MSLYHLSRTVVKRSAGSSACKVLSYIHRTQIRDEALGKTYSFNSKEGEIVESKLYLPEDVPSSVRELLMGRSDVQARFAQLVESVENEVVDKRCKSEEARESYKSRMQVGFMEVIALQKELSLKQNQEVLDSYIQKVYIPRGLIVSCAIHFEEDNPHAHLFLNLRAVNKEGFSSVKERELLTRAGLKSCREIWAGVTNDYFKSLGLENRISHKSFKSLNVGLVPTIHEGDARYTKFSEDVVETNKIKNERVKARNRELLQKEPEKILPLLMSKGVAFKEADIRRELHRYFPDNLKKVSELVVSLLESKEIVRIKGTSGKELVYTTQAYLRSEESLLDGARNLNREVGYGVSEKSVEKKISQSFGYLSSEQKKAVYSATQARSLNLVIGKAGAGKSTMMKAVAECYKSEGYRVFGGAWSGSAAEEISNTVGIHSQTLLSWFNTWERFEEKAYNPRSAGGFFRSGYFLDDYKKQLNHKSVFILDEAGTVDVEHMSKLLIKAHAVGAKVILVGDISQTRPIGPGEAFRALCEIYPTSQLKEIKRQTEPWMRSASQELSQHHISKGLQAYASEGYVTWYDKKSLHNEIVENFLSSYQQNTHQVALAYRNEDVFQLNISIHTKLKDSGSLGKRSLLVSTQTSYGAPTVEFTEKNRILFLQNDPRGKKVKTTQGGQKGITNGTLGTILRVKSDQLKIKLDDSRIVTLNPKEYPYLSHGYALSIHKAQGKTFDQSYVLINSPMEAADTYVALTRHRTQCQIYVNQNKFKDMHSLIQSVSKERPVDFIKQQKERVQEKEQKPLFYDRSEILSKVGRNEILQLMESYTPFQHNPRASRGDTLVFSESGQGTSVNVTLKPEGPLVHNFKDGYGADLIGFLSHYSHNNYGQMCRELGERFGLNQAKNIQREPCSKPHTFKTQKEQTQDNIIKRQALKKEDIKRIQKQVKFLKSAKGTLAETYLNKRGIFKSIPEDLRFQNSRKYGPSLVAMARDYEGNITGLQRTRLDPTTSYKITEKPAKLSQGCIYGSSVRLQKDDQNTKMVFLAEGVETALSLREAVVKGEIRAVLGKSNLLTVGMTLQFDQRIILAVDNDGKPWREDEGLLKIITKLRAEGYTVDVLFPEIVDGKSKVDFNDLINFKRGKVELRAILEGVFHQQKSL